ncbi:MAG: hypothetical protein OJF50_000254 [Nitrospira sp.]|jgi:sporulation protein YlmC with PRC-barrel domain|nr:hypothetical protein [Nitrospira sp.]
MRVLSCGSPWRTQRNLMNLAVGAVAILLLVSDTAWAQAKADKADRLLSAVVTDSQGVETEVKNLIFYWEEKVSETAFVPHELKHMPVKRGTATVNVKFDTIKQIEARPHGEKGLPFLTIALTNGKSAEFVAAMNGSFRGESDFGQVDIPVNAVSKVIFK